MENIPIYNVSRGEYAAYIFVTKCNSSPVNCLFFLR